MVGLRPKISKSNKNTVYRVQIKNNFMNYDTNADSSKSLNGKDNIDEKKSNISCVICLDDIDIHSTSIDDQIKCLPCGHVFHQNCIEEWFSSKEKNAVPNEEVKLNCPICRHTAR